MSDPCTTESPPMSSPGLLRVWITESAGSEDLVMISMRSPLGSRAHSRFSATFPGRDRRTMEQHEGFGLFEIDDLVLIRDAINKFLMER